MPIGTIYNNNTFNDGKTISNVLLLLSTALLFERIHLVIDTIISKKNPFKNIWQDDNNNGKFNFVLLNTNLLYKPKQIDIAYHDTVYVKISK